METIKQINIKNRTYHFYSDIINLYEFDESKIKVDKKDFNNIDIYYLGYEYQKIITECNKIKSVNPIYLRIRDMKGKFEKSKDGAWYLIISYKDNVSEKLMDVFESIKNKIIEKTLGTVEYDKDYMKIKFESNNISPEGNDSNIRLATIIIRAIFAQDCKYYPQLFLDDGLYKNVAV